jgi:LPS-assembly protein
MLRSSPFWIAILSLGSITPAVRAADPPCPSQAQDSVTPASPAPAPSVNADTGNFDVTSDQATLGVNGNATLKGNVDVRQGVREIHADEVEYDAKTGALKTQGNIDYRDPIVHVTGEGGSYSPTQGADFKSAQFELQQRAARGSAETMRLTPEGLIDLKGVTFTTCPMTDEAWRLRAKSISLDTRTRIGSGRAARVDFKGVPLVYLPWLSFPLGTQRKSGFLFPSIGNSTRSGAQVAIPYYWNIAPNADFTFDPLYYSKRGTDLGGDLRYLTKNQHGELTWNYLSHDAVFGSSRSRVKLVDVAELPRDFRLSINAENVSDSQYFEDFAQGPEGTSTAFVERRATLTYRDEHWRVDGEAQQFQTIDTTLAVTDRPYARVPRLAVNADYGWGPTERLRYGFDSEIVNFDRSFGVTGWRVDLMPTASLNFDSPSYFVRPAIAWRGTQYELSNVAPGTDRAPLRTLPIASFDTGLLFERDSGSRAQRRLTLEPRLLYLYVPFRRQDQLPLFDTALPDLYPVELFRTNRYVGADRVADANQVSVGVTSRLLDAHDGRQFLAATFGEAFYFETPRVVLPGEAIRTDRRSDFVAQLALTAFQNWGADFGLQWNPQTSQSQRAQVNVQYKPAGQQVVNLGYRYQRGTLQLGNVLQSADAGLEQVELSGAWPISRSWNVFLRSVYSLRDNKELERFGAFEYRACCWRLRMGARRFVSNRTGSQDTGIYLQLELTGLASVGSASDSFLTEAIRGYMPPETSPQKLKVQ